MTTFDKFYQVMRGGLKIPLTLILVNMAALLCTKKILEDKFSGRDGKYCENFPMTDWWL